MMLSVSDAQKRLLAALKPVGVERVPLMEAAGRILVEDIYTDVDLPPFSNSSMDGFAVRSVDVAGATEANPVTLRVVDDIPAGRLAERALRASRGLEGMRR